MHTAPNPVETAGEPSPAVLRLDDIGEESSELSPEDFGFMNVKAPVEVTRAERVRDSWAQDYKLGYIGGNDPGYCYCDPDCVSHCR